jgi:ammonium transporter, Amt family
MLKVTDSVSLITQSLSGIFILCIMWHLFGFTLVFAPSLGGVIGNLDHILMLDVPYDACSRHAPHIPAALFGFFQMMFAAIAPILITGAFIERLRFKAFIIFIIGWEIFIYYPVAHWIWGGGWLKTVFGVLVCILCVSHLEKSKVIIDCIGFCRWNSNSYHIGCFGIGLCNYARTKKRL